MEEIEEKEEWRGCGESNKRLYEVSNLGRVRSITKKGKEKILKGGFDSDGYLQVRVSKIIKIHTLVAFAFLGPRPEGLQIDHIDRCKSNNRFDNLRYCTSSENNTNRDYYRHDILETNQIEREKIRAKERHTTKVNCICGSIISKHSIPRHERAPIHQNWLKNNP